MPQDLRGPPSPEPEQASDDSLAETIRGAMLGIGEIGLAIGSDGSHGTYPEHSHDDSAPARTWWGRILQWAWALTVFLIGLAALALAILVGIGWVMDLFG